PYRGADAEYLAVSQCHGNADLWSVHPRYIRFYPYHASPIHVPISHVGLHHLKEWSQIDLSGYNPNQLASRFPNGGESREWLRRNASHLQRSCLKHQKYFCL